MEGEREYDNVQTIRNTNWCPFSTGTRKLKERNVGSHTVAMAITDERLRIAVTERTTYGVKTALAWDEPLAFCYVDEDNIYVGREALQYRRLNAEGAYFEGFTRFIGLHKNHIKIRDALEKWPCPYYVKSKGDFRLVSCGGSIRHWYPGHLLFCYFQVLVTKLPAHLRGLLQSPSEVFVAVPADWCIIQRTSFREVLTKCGYNVLRVISLSEAALYNLTLKTRSKECVRNYNMTVVCDGGSVEASIGKEEEGKIEILAGGGIPLNTKEDPAVITRNYWHSNWPGDQRSMKGYYASQLQGDMDLYGYAAHNSKKAWSRTTDLVWYPELSKALILPIEDLLEFLIKLATEKDQNICRSDIPKHTIGVCGDKRKHVFQHAYNIYSEPWLNGSKDDLVIQGSDAIISGLINMSLLADPILEHKVPHGIFFKLHNFKIGPASDAKSYPGGQKETDEPMKPIEYLDEVKDWESCSQLHIGEEITAYRIRGERVLYETLTRLPRPAPLKNPEGLTIKYCPNGLIELHNSQDVVAKYRKFEGQSGYNCRLDEKETHSGWFPNTLLYKFGVGIPTSNSTFVHLKPARLGWSELVVIRKTIRWF